MDHDTIILIMQRAFELARQGTCDNVGEILRHLIFEAYDPATVHSIVGQTLSGPLTNVIAEHVVADRQDLA